MPDESHQDERQEKVRQLSQYIAEVEAANGSDSVHVARALEEAVAFLVQNQVGLGHVDSMLARAKTIRANLEATPNGIASSKFATSICRFCGEVNGMDSAYCNQCGKPFTEGAPAVQGTYSAVSKAIDEPTMGSESKSETKKCSFCAEFIMKDAIKCKHCGSKVSEQVRKPGVTPWLMALASFFVPGLGQIIMGQVGKGSATILFVIIFGLLTFGLSSLIVIPCAVIDAYNIARKLRNGESVGTWEWAIEFKSHFARVVIVLVVVPPVGIIGLALLVELCALLQKPVSDRIAQDQQAANDAASKVPSLAGTWELAFQSALEQQPHPGQMQLIQNGSNIQGQGQDLAPFVLNGTFDPPKIMFYKQYVVDGQPKGKPVTWMGQVTFSKDEAPSMEGVFIAYGKGVLSAEDTGEVRGRWQAQMVGVRQPGDR